MSSQGLCPALHARTEPPPAAFQEVGIRTAGTHARAPRAPHALCHSACPLRPPLYACARMNIRAALLWVTMKAAPETPGRGFSAWSRAVTSQVHTEEWTDWPRARSVEPWEDQPPSRAAALLCCPPACSTPAHPHQSLLFLLQALLALTKFCSLTAALLCLDACWPFVSSPR